MKWWGMKWQGNWPSPKRAWDSLVHSWPRSPLDHVLLWWFVTRAHECDWQVSLSMPQFPIPKPKLAHHYLPDPTKPAPWAFQFSDTLSNNTHTQNIDNTLEMDIESNFQSTASWTQSLLFGMKITPWRQSELRLHQWAKHCISYSIIFIDSIVG